ncbi:hypothetical protein [uncultured Dysosmobacter sp.]|uniref:hypothetical protein n=1 Tax=uncultured Dysosmobacter sp. TaxID=2591384 RepID=UPI0026065E45|nr:hypothetical protein [uncultured Dysosmobacter sp.]
MTHHGLQHSCAARTYRELIENGAAPLDASYQVSRLLGHERPDETINIHLDAYGRVSQKMRQQSANRMEQFIRKVSG